MAKSFSVFVNIGARVGSSFSRAIQTVESRLNGLSRRFEASALAAKSAFKQIGDSMKGIAGLAAAGGLTFGIKHALKDGAEFAHEIQALKNAGRTTKEVAEAIAAANKTIGELPTTTLAENLKVINETTGAFGDYHHALENLTFNQRIGSMLQNALGHKAGDPGEMFNSLVRAFEIRGTAADHHVYQKEVSELYRAMMFTRGNVNPQEMLNFAQMANPAIKNYSERFLTKIAPSLIQEFGGDRAGTRAGAWYNAIMGKTRDKRMADAWVKLGLLDKKNVLTNKKTGDIIGWNPGAMKGTDEAMADPLAWTEKYLIPALKKRGINTDDQMSVTKELGKLFRNSEANRFANAITQSRDRKRLHKDEGLINQVPDADKAYEDTLLNDPKFAKLALKAALDSIGSSLTVALMKPAAQAMTALARALQSVAQTFVRYPNFAKAAGAVAVALTGMAAVKLAGFILGVTGLGRALVFLALSAPIGLAGRLIGLTRGIVALTAAVTLGSVARVRALGLAIKALWFGSAAAGLATLGRGFIAVLAPMALFRAGLRLVRLALIGTGIGAAIVGLGVAFEFLSRNWTGMGKGLEAFGAAFQKALPPDLADRVKPVVEALKGLFGGEGMKFSDAQWQEWGTSFGATFGAQVAELTTKVETFVAALDKIKNFKVSWSDLVSFNETTQNDMIGRFSTYLIEQIRAKSGEFAEACKGLAKSGFDAVASYPWQSLGIKIIEAIAGGIAGAAGTLANALKGAVSGAWESAKGAIGLGSTPAAPKPPGAPAAAPGAPVIAGERALGGPVTGGLPYLVGERGPEIFVPSTSGRIETNGVLNSISKAGGRAASGNGLTIGVDATAVEEAGKTAKAAGAQLHAALDATRKPVVDTSSIDAATASAEKLKAVLASVSAGTIRVGGEVSGGDSSTAEDAVGRAVRGGSAGAVGSRVASGSAGGAGSAVGALGRAGAAAPGGGDSVTVNGHRYRAGAGSEEGKQRVASWLGFLQRPLDQGGLGLEADKSRAMVAMLQGESHANLNPGALGDHRRGKPTAFGTAQWRLDRADALRAVAAKMGRPWSDVEAQQAHFRNEMLGRYRPVFDAVKAAPSGEHALAIGIDKYENPAKKALAYKFRKPYLDTLRRQDAQAGGAKPAVAAVKPAPAAAESGKDSEKKEPVALAGARALGGPVSRGLSYLVGERGPEIFTPGASGGISTNSTLNRLADIGSRTVPADEGGRSPSIAPSPKTVAELRPQGGNISTRGDTHYAPSFTIHGASDPQAVRRQVEANFFDMIRQHESDQRGLLSD